MLSGFDEYNKAIEQFKKTKLAQKYSEFIGILKGINKDAPLKSNWLEGSLDVTGAEIRTMVSIARLEKKPIASCGKGYFWAKNMQELRETVDHIHQRKVRLDMVEFGLTNADFTERELSLL